MGSEGNSSTTAASPNGKRSRDPEDEVYVDNLRSHKRYLSEVSLILLLFFFFLFCFLRSVNFYSFILFYWFFFFLLSGLVLLGINNRRMQISKIVFWKLFFLRMLKFFVWFGLMDVNLAIVVQDFVIFSVAFSNVVWYSCR